jgi:hypothetical protein
MFAIIISPSLGILALSTTAISHGNIPASIIESPFTETKREEIGFSIM